MEIKEIKKLRKNLPRFFCKSCDFECYMKCDWDRHILRPKHLANVDGNVQETKKLKKTYNCDCGKIFQSNSGLWKHKKVCDFTENEEKEENEENEQHKKEEITDKDLIIMLIKQNSQLIEKNNDLTEKNIEIFKNINSTNNSHNNNTTNSHSCLFPGREIL